MIVDQEPQCTQCKVIVSIPAQWWIGGARGICCRTVVLRNFECVAKEFDSCQQVEPLGRMGRFGPTCIVGRSEVSRELNMVRSVQSLLVLRGRGSRACHWTESGGGGGVPLWSKGLCGTVGALKVPGSSWFGC